MRKVCRLGREVLDIVATDYLDEIVHRECIKRNVSNFNLVEIIQAYRY